MTTELFDTSLLKDVFGFGIRRLELLKCIIAILDGDSVINDLTPEADARFVKSFLAKQLPTIGQSDDFNYPPSFSKRDCNDAALGARTIYEHFRIDLSPEDYPQTPIRLLDLFQSVNPTETALYGSLQEIAEP